MIVAVDTNIIVAAIERLPDENTPIVPLDVLVEAYSVRTRLPRPFRATLNPTVILSREDGEGSQDTHFEILRFAQDDEDLVEGLQVLSP